MLYFLNRWNQECYSSFLTQVESLEDYQNVLFIWMMSMLVKTMQNLFTMRMRNRTLFKTWAVAMELLSIQ